MDDDFGSECGDDAFIYSDRDSDDDGCGLADAFQEFEAQAEQRTLELLDATDCQLFEARDEDVEANSCDAEEDAPEGSFPAYVYMSDQFRLKKPPQFRDWQQTFQYLQISGAFMLEGESMEHIQSVSMKATDLTERCDQADGGELRVDGHACLQSSTAGSEFQEEIIMCDGVMEETIEQDKQADDDMNLESRRFSPSTAHIEEVLDTLTIECYSQLAVPQLTSLFTTILEKQQHSVRAAREESEAAANRTIEEQQAVEKARQLQLEQEALEEAARVEALEIARQFEERREAERRELLLKQQMEENDEEEIKIKTLAYSHTREWTYLKPVLQAKESDEVIHERSPPSSSDKRSSKRQHTLKQARSVTQKTQPEWVTGGALTNDKLCDISWVKKIARPPPRSPPAHVNGARRKRENENQNEEAPSSGGVRLPVIVTNAKR